MSLSTVPWPIWGALTLLLAALAWRARQGRRRARAALRRAQEDMARLRLDHQVALDRAQAAAEAADLAKTRFLAAASHDLRQPAHALGLYLATLRAGELAPAQAELAERMAAALGALQTMFAALLDVSRIDAGSLAPQWSLVPLAPLLRRLADEHAGAAEARGLRLSLHLADEAATSVTDPLLLERVLRNLLANAVQNTTAGGVLLACRRRGPGEAARWRIEVWDSGCGIAPADQERVFQEFQQLGQAGAGLGLGLPIARRLAQLLQLKLALHSRPGRGSVFFVDGLAPAGAAPLRAAAARQDLRRLAGAKVAVLDDDEDVRRATRGLLQRWECTVHDAADADALLAQAATRPQALIADLQLAGGRHGITEAQRLFAAWGGVVPLLLVSGDSLASVPAGLDAHILAKPASPARLRAWLEQVLAAPEGEAA
jgi:two-component system, sensor histidine kinase